jgi:hypothetical protein
MTKRALIVGIDAYAPPNTLPSCTADANAFKALVGTQYKFDDVKLLLDTDATKTAVLDGLKWLFAQAAPRDELVFFYSGHGYQPEINGELREALVTQDGKFLDDTELAAAMGGVPDGILSIVLDTCFSGGLEKLFVTDTGLVNVVIPKYWKPTVAAPDGQRTAVPTQARAFRPFGRVAPTASKGFVPPGTDATITSLTLPASKGLLMSAAQEDETASASTPATGGKSAFTYALLKAVTDDGATSSSVQLVRAAGATLHRLGLRQTPALKEPIQPAGMGNDSFITLQPLQPSPAGAGAGTAVQPPQESTMQNYLSQISQSYPFAPFAVFPPQGGQADKGWLDSVTGAVTAIIPHLIPIVTQALQSKGYAPQAGAAAPAAPAAPAYPGSADKGWFDSVTSAVTAIVPHLIPIVAQALQSKGYAPQASAAAPAAPAYPGSADKGWLDSVTSAVTAIVPHLIPIVAQALQSKGYSPAGAAPAPSFAPPPGFDQKGWLDVLGQVTQTALPIALSLL